MTERRIIEERLRELHRQYAKELPHRIAEIRTLWRALQAGDEAVRPELQRLVHQLGGSGATFGFVDITVQARRLEALLNANPGGPLPVNDIEATLEALTRQCPESSRPDTQSRQ